MVFGHSLRGSDMDGNDISPSRPVALCHLWRNRSARLVLSHLYARNTLFEAMGTETVSRENLKSGLRLHS